MEMVEAPQPVVFATNKALLLSFFKYSLSFIKYSFTHCDLRVKNYFRSVT
jgi:hypothetical protein